MHYYFDVIKKYAVFDGRAARAEYWMFVLVNAIVGTILDVLSYLINPQNTSIDIFRIINWVYVLALLIPSIAVGFRRLHDTGKSAWWLFIALIPIVGATILLVFFVQDSELGTNKYGPNPKEGGQMPPQMAATQAPTEAPAPEMPQTQTPPSETPPAAT